MEVLEKMKHFQNQILFSSLQQGPVFHSFAVFHRYIFLCLTPLLGLTSLQFELALLPPCELATVPRF